MKGLERNGACCSDVEAAAEKIIMEAGGKLSESFFVVDTDALVRRCCNQLLEDGCSHPPFVAVKDCCDVSVIKILHAFGFKFVCESKAEAELTVGSAGVDPVDVLYAAALKPTSQLRHMVDILGVTLVTCSGEMELRRLVRVFGDDAGVATVLVDVAGNSEPPNDSFVKDIMGCSMEKAVELLVLARELGVGRVGVRVVEAGVAAAVAQRMEHAGVCLDVVMLPKLTTDLEDGFDWDQTSVETETNGSCFFQDIFSLVVQVIDKRESGEHHDWNGKGGKIAVTRSELVVNDSICKSFQSYLENTGNCYQEVPKVVGGKKEELLQQLCTILGCHADEEPLDCLCKSCLLANSIDVGDWLIFRGVPPSRSRIGRHLCYMSVLLDEDADH